jgi:hypothetical protein
MITAAPVWGSPRCSAVACFVILALLLFAYFSSYSKEAVFFYNIFLIYLLSIFLAAIVSLDLKQICGLTLTRTTEKRGYSIVDLYYLF